MKRKQRPPEDAGTWMNTYSDLVTLLLTFFVLLFSFSSINEEKWEQFVKAFMNPGEDTAQIVLETEDPQSGTGLVPLGGDNQPPEDVDPPETEDSPLPADFNDLYRYLKAYTEEQNMQDSVEITKKGESVVYIRFQNNIFFDPDKAYLRPSSYEVLGFLGDCLYNVEDEIYMISINGHTASVDNPETYGVSDWMLSSERASNIAIYLDDKKNIEPKKLRPMGYGKNFPIAPNDTAEGMERNRRVDMTIIKDDGDMEQDAAMYQELASLFDPDRFPKSGGAKDILEAASEDEPGQSAEAAENAAAAAMGEMGMESSEA